MRIPSAAPAATCGASTTRSIASICAGASSSFVSEAAPCSSSLRAVTRTRASKLPTAELNAPTDEFRARPSFDTIAADGRVDGRDRGVQGAPELRQHPGERAEARVELTPELGDLVRRLGQLLLA